MQDQNPVLCHVQALSSTSNISELFEKKLSTVSDHGLHLQQNTINNNDMTSFSKQVYVYTVNEHSKISTCNNVHM